MGLDITVYRKLTEVVKPERDEDGDLTNFETEWTPGASMEWSEKHFPGRGEGLDPRKVYNWKEKYRFRAGSYGGYGVWRSKLNQFMGDSAFQELINFADNEGVIGPVVSKKLAKDFLEHEEEAKQFAETLGDAGADWYQRYEEWKDAFDFASDAGAVVFG